MEKSLLFGWRQGAKASRVKITKPFVVSSCLSCGVTKLDGLGLAWIGLNRIGLPPVLFLCRPRSETAIQLQSRVCLKQHPSTRRLGVENARARSLGSLGSLVALLCIALLRFACLAWPVVSCPVPWTTMVDHPARRPANHGGINGDSRP